jgi:hypothetical protein
VSDILLKGIVTSITTSKEDTTEGGLLQRLHEYNENTAPGGAELPFSVSNESRKKMEAKKVEEPQKILRPIDKMPMPEKEGNRKQPTPQPTAKGR